MDTRAHKHARAFNGAGSWNPGDWKTRDWKTRERIGYGKTINLNSRHTKIPDVNWRGLTAAESGSKSSVSEIRLNTTCEVHRLAFHTCLSRVYQSCSLVLRFPVPRFPTMHFWPSRIFQSHVSRVFSPTPFNGPFSGTTRVSLYQKGISNLDFTEATDSEWQWHQLVHMQVCTSLNTDNHISTTSLSFSQAGCPSCRPTNSVKALKAKPLASLQKHTPLCSKLNYR